MSDPPPPTGPRILAIPPGDERERLVCPDCGYVAYHNPLIVVGAVAVWGEGGDERVLLCRRAIEPRRGFWTLPAGFLEEHETTAAGAAREAWEEARADLVIGDLLAVWEIVRISQVQFIYRARLRSPDIAPGPESLEVGLFAWDAVPWDDLAFPTVAWSLLEHRARRGQTGFTPATTAPG